jgi:hypothetical protein
MQPDVFERLVAANIEVLPGSMSNRHVVFARDGFVALVELTGAGFGSVGSAGMLTEKGFAPLTSKNGTYYFVAKNLERPASDAEVDKLRAFQHDLQSALASPDPAK